MRFITPVQGRKMRTKRKAYAEKNYIAKHTDAEYIKFMESQVVISFVRNHDQDQNHNEVHSLFTIVSQHVYGDCIQECLDKAIQIAIYNNV